MRRLLGLGLLVVLVLGVVVVASAAGGSDDGPSGYRVKAIFDDAPVNVGADVLVAGVAVGKVTALDVTPEHKAALTLAIDDARFAPFHADATCGTRPQSLIGERSVACEIGTAKAPKLATVDGGAHVLPVDRTTSSVDLDLVNAIWRRPADEQLRILLSELGASTAARGPELAAIIRRANPALVETDRLVALLGNQTDALERMATDGERVLKPLAAQRRRLVGFIGGAQRTGAAAARQPAAFGRGLERLPAMLRSLTPLMAQLRTFAAGSTPVLRQIADGAPALGQATAELPGFARRSEPAIQALGRTGKAQQRDLPRLVALSRTLEGVGQDVTAPAQDLAALTTSLERDRAIPNLLDLFYVGASAGNAFDEDGHYLRGEVLSGACGQYTNEQFFGCDAQFGDAKLSSRSLSVRRAADARLRAATKRPAKRATQDWGVRKGDGDGSAALLDFLLGSDGR